ncbi:MAG: hypothetical protein HOC71_09855 [Candidatus Latescibacteria bacterium]|jgi:hypothetical protein|nr:hypothetical protein [Candidatus Latescibacterota bacterium]
MQLHEIHQQFEKILRELRNIQGLPEESAVQVAQVILQEAGKDRRGELANNAKSSSNGYYSSSQSCENGSNQSATEKQKNSLTMFGIEYSDDITKVEASKLLDKAFEKLDSRKKVGRKAPFLLDKVTPEMFKRLHNNGILEDEIKVVEEEVNEIYGEDMEEYLVSYPFPMSGF